MKSFEEMNRWELLQLTQDDVDLIDGLFVINEDTGEMATKDQIADLIAEKNNKIMAYYDYARQNAEMFKEQAKKFAALQKEWERKCNSIAEQEKIFMLASGKKKITGPWGQASLRKSNVLEVVDEAKAIKVYDKNPELFNVKITPKKSDIKALIKSGEKVDGYAIVEKQNITIK